MKVSIEMLAHATVLVAQGRLDFGSAGEFQRQIEQALRGPAMAPTALVVDCAALEYVSSAGLRVFLVAARAAQRSGIAFSLCALQPAVREVFDVSGFSRILSVHADRTAAFAHAAGPGA